MRILIYSTSFSPETGGIAFMTRVLAEEFATIGHEVIVATTIKAELEASESFRIIREATLAQLFQLARRADVVIQMNVSLKTIFLFLLAKRPLIVTHGGMYRRSSGRKGIRDRLKYWVSRCATNVACSEAVKRDLPADTTVIWNAYDDSIFKAGQQERLGELVFLGRLVSEKGVDILLQSLMILRQRGLRPALTIIGEGPERPRLQQFCGLNELSEQVRFVGKLEGRELCRVISGHEILVAPSRNEGFGIVALEGIACGCIVVASSVGGLPEAVGDCGLLFKNGDSDDLARALSFAMNAGKVQFSETRERHLACCTRDHVARRYLEVVKMAMAYQSR